MNFDYNKFKKHFLLLVLPTIFIIYLFYLLNAKGPAWIMQPQDLGYTYLISAVNILQSDPVGVFIHPAITVIGFFAFVTQVLFLLSDKESLIDDVLMNTDYYFNTSVYISIFLCGLANYLMGLLTFNTFKKYSYIFVLQSFFLIPSPENLILNSFASPECFLVIISMLLVGFIIKLAETYKFETNNIYIILLLGTFFSGFALATKFIATPFLSSFFFMSKGIKRKIYFCVFLLISLLMTFGLLFLTDAYKILFDNATALIKSLDLERSTRGQSSLLDILIPIKILWNNETIYTLLNFIILFFSIILLSLKQFRNFIKSNNPDLIHAFWTITFVTLTGFFMVCIRPIGKYTVIFYPYLFASCLLFIFFINSFLKTNLNKYISYSLFSFMPFLLVGFIYKHHNFANSTSITEFKKYQKMARSMYEITYKSTNQNIAILNAIPASNRSNALYHSFGVNKSKNVSKFRKYIDNRNFDYNFDGLTAYYYGAGQISLSKLMEKYKKIYFWTSNGNFRAHEWRIEPDAIWKDVLVGGSERLAVFEALSITKKYNKDNLNDINTWKQSVCKDDKKCFIYNMSKEIDKKLISHFKLIYYGKKDVMPKLNVIIEGSTDGNDWKKIKTIDQQSNVLKNMTDPNSKSKIYSVNNKVFYNFFRISFLDYKIKENYFPYEFNLYSNSRCSDKLRILEKNRSFISVKEKQKFKTVLIKEERKDNIINDFHNGNFTEIVNLPITLESDFSKKLNIKGYFFSVPESSWKENISRMPSEWEVFIQNNNGKWEKIDEKSKSNWKYDDKMFFPINKNNVKKIRIKINDVVDSERVARFGQLKYIEQDGTNHVVNLNNDNEIKKRILDGKPMHSFIEYFFKRKGDIYLETTFNEKENIIGYTLNVAHGNHKENLTRMPTSWTIYKKTNDDTWEKVQEKSKNNWKYGDQTYFPISANDVKKIRIKIKEVKNLGHIIRLDSIKYYSKRKVSKNVECEESFK